MEEMTGKLFQKQMELSLARPKLFYRGLVNKDTYILLLEHVILICTCKITYLSRSTYYRTGIDCNGTFWKIRFYVISWKVR